MKNVKIDISLRDVISNLPTKFIKLLTGNRGKKLLDSSLPDVKDKKADLVVLMEDNSIFHLELQSYNDINMPFRMLEYYLLLREKYKNYKINQMCLYVGDKPVNMKNYIKEKNLNFSYTLKDIKELNCEELLNSSEFEDKLLAVLCDIKESDRYINGIIKELLKLNENKRKDAIKKLLSFSRYRPKINDKLIKKLKEEIMPLTIDLKQDPYYKQGLKRGLEEGIQKTKIEDAILMIKDFNIKAEVVAKKLNLPLNIILKKLKEQK
jgi:predicted transposase YdaD